MNDTLRFIEHDPIHRKYHHDLLTFSMLYAFTENFLLPFSHDEVVHGKCSMLNKMPGDEWQRHANLRTLYALPVHPSGQETAVHGHRVRPGHGVGQHPHARLVCAGLPAACRDEAHGRDLNRLYRVPRAPHDISTGRASSGSIATTTTNPC